MTEFRGVPLGGPGRTGSVSFILLGSASCSACLNTVGHGEAFSCEIYMYILPAMEDNFASKSTCVNFNVELSSLWS